jgi:hypothetical protein
VRGPFVSERTCRRRNSASPARRSFKSLGSVSAPDRRDLSLSRETNTRTRERLQFSAELRAILRTTRKAAMVSDRSQTLASRPGIGWPSAVPDYRWFRLHRRAPHRRALGSRGDREDRRRRPAPAAAHLAEARVRQGRHPGPQQDARAARAPRDRHTHALRLRPQPDPRRGQDVRHRRQRHPGRSPGRRRRRYQARDPDLFRDRLRRLPTTPSRLRRTGLSVARPTSPTRSTRRIRTASRSSGLCRIRTPS